MVVEMQVGQPTSAPAGSSQQYENNVPAVAMAVEEHQAEQPADSLADSATPNAVPYPDAPGPSQLALIPMVVTAFAELIREHGDCTDQFKLFCRTNGPLNTLRQLWMRKVKQCPAEQPTQLHEWDDFENSRLLKGLLQVAGFRAELRMPSERGTEAAAAADGPLLMQDWEDGGYLCSLDTVAVSSTSCSKSAG